MPNCHKCPLGIPNKLKEGKELSFTYMLSKLQPDIVRNGPDDRILKADLESQDEALNPCASHCHDSCMTQNHGGKSFVSLDATLRGDGQDFEESIPVGRGSGDEWHPLFDDFLRSVWFELKKISDPKHRWVVLEMICNDKTTLKEIGRSCGLTQQQVWNIKKRAVKDAPMLAKKLGGK